MSNIDDHQFDLDDVLRLTRPIAVESDDWGNLILKPLDLADPFVIVESVGWTGKHFWTTFTASDGESYHTTEIDAFAPTGHSGEQGLYQAAQDAKVQK